MNYARICTTVLYHPDLSAGSKILFGVIHSYPVNTCFASDLYFAKLLHCSKPTIQRQLVELKAAGFVMSVIKYADDKKTIKSRRLRVAKAVTVSNKKDASIPVAGQAVALEPVDIFAMTMEWQPGELFSDRLKRSGINYSAIHESTRNELLGEFKSYWLSQPDRLHSESEWLHRLLTNFIRAGKNRLYETPKPAEQSIRNRPLVDSLTDTSWAEKTPMEILNG
tara:strand:- start:388 stop:1056 length:669 start_codon:yes stop_codon:yes gene_type:complete